MIEGLERATNIDASCPESRGKLRVRSARFEEDEIPAGNRMPNFQAVEQAIPLVALGGDFGLIIEMYPASWRLTSDAAVASRSNAPGAPIPARFKEAACALGATAKPMPVFWSTEISIGEMIGFDDVLHDLLCLCDDVTRGAKLPDKGIKPDKF